MSLPKDRSGEVWSSPFYVFLVVRSRLAEHDVLILATNEGVTFEAGQVVTPYGGDGLWEDNTHLTRLA